MSSISSKQTGKDSPLRFTQEQRVDYRNFIQKQIDLPETNTYWGAMCESLQRQAHGLEAEFSSAYAHMVSTPKSEKVDPRDAPAGYFIFVDDPNDSNRFGHVVGKWNKANNEGRIIAATNDVNDSHSSYDYGNVTLVDLDWFPKNWGDRVQFATSWFGSQKIDTAPVAVDKDGLRPKVDTKVYVQAAINRAEGVIDMMNKAIRDNDGKQHPNHERALRRERNEQRKNINDLKLLLP